MNVQICELARLKMREFERHVESILGPLVQFHVEDTQKRSQGTSPVSFKIGQLGYMGVQYQRVEELMVRRNRRGEAERGQFFKLL